MAILTNTQLPQENTAIKTITRLFLVLVGILKYYSYTGIIYVICHNGI